MNLDVSRFDIVCRRIDNLHWDFLSILTLRNKVWCQVVESILLVNLIHMASGRWIPKGMKKSLMKILDRAKALETTKDRL